MATGRMGISVYLRQAALGGAGEKTDGQLLGCFLGGSEAAFEALVRRHGPLVWGVCRRVLGHTEDAEDAFQATFLVLVRKATSIRQLESVASWLYGAAYRAALEARAARHRSREKQVSAMPEPEVVPPDEPADLRPLIDHELNRLSQRYREAVVLCDLEGKTRKEAARLVGVAEGTLSGRLTRGRRLLAGRLARRGVTLSATALAATLSQEAASARVPATLIGPTVEAAARLAAGRAASSAASTHVAFLMEGVLKAMLLTKLRIATAVLLVAAVAAPLAHHLLAKSADQPAKGVDARPAPQHKPQTRTDLLGDPLPPGALARLGTERFRHGDGIDSLAFSPDGKTLAAADWNRNLGLWDSATGKTIWRVRSKDTYRCPRFLAGGKVLAVGSGDHLKLLDAATGKELRRVAAPDGIVLCALSPDGKNLATGPFKSTVLRILEVDSGKELFRFEVTDLIAVTYSPDGKTLAGVGLDGHLRTWEAATGKKLLEIEAPVTKRENPYLSLVYSPDGRTLALGEGRMIRLWEVTTGKQRRVLHGHGHDVGSVAFAPDGKTLASAGRDNTVRLWDPATGRLLRTMRGHSSWVQCVAFSPDSNTIASAGQDHVIRLWEVATGKQVPTHDGHQSRATALAVSPDGKTAASAGFHGEIRVWELATGKPLQRLSHLEGPMALAYTPDGKAIASAGWNGSVRLADLSTGKEIRQFIGHKDGVCSLTISADGKTLVTGGDDRTVRLWDLQTGKERLCLKGHGYWVRTVAISQDGQVVVSGSAEGTVRLWDAATGKQRQLIASGGLVNAVAISPDGKSVASAAGRGHVRLWDVGTGKQVREFKLAQSRYPRRTGQMVIGGTVVRTDDLGTARRVLGVAFSPDGRSLATAEDDHSVVVWEVNTGRPRLELHGHRGPVRAVAFAASGKVLASLSNDLTTLAWDATGRLVFGQTPARLSQRELEGLWGALAGDAGQAFRAINTLGAASAQAVPLLRDRLRPAVAADDARVARLLADLDSQEFATRERATAELSRLGAAAELPLRRVLAAKPSLEVRRRIERLVQQLEGGDVIRVLRAFEALERASTPEARRVLKALAKGAAEARLTREAKAALARLK